MTGTGRALAVSTAADTSPVRRKGDPGGLEIHLLVGCRRRPKRGGACRWRLLRDGGVGRRTAGNRHDPPRPPCWRPTLHPRSARRRVACHAYRHKTPERSRAERLAARLVHPLGGSATQPPACPDPLPSYARAEAWRGDHGRDVLRAVQVGPQQRGCATGPRLVHAGHHRAPLLAHRWCLAALDTPQVDRRAYACSERKAPPDA